LFSGIRVGITCVLAASSLKNRKEQALGRSYFRLP